MQNSALKNALVGKKAFEGLLAIIGAKPRTREHVTRAIVADETIRDLLHRGIQAARGGNPAMARRLLQQVTERAPENELAWIWLATVAADTEQRKRCLERVLEINPANERAKEALARLQRVPRSAPPTTPAERAPLPAAPPLTAPNAPSRSTQNRRMSPFFFGLAAFLALFLIGAGAILLLEELQAPTPTPTTTPSPAPTTPPTTTAGGYITPTPVGGQVRTLQAHVYIPPTWTPTATWTPSATPTYTPTPPPPETYTLLVSSQYDDPPSWRLFVRHGETFQMLQFYLSDALNAEHIIVLDMFDAAYSPDGKWMAFSMHAFTEREQDGQKVTVEFEDLFIAGAGGGEVRRLTALEAPHVEDVSWAPDGHALAFASDQDGDFEIYILPLEDGIPGKPYPLTRNNVTDRDPAWSPNGDIIVFASDRQGPGDLEIYRMSPRGDNLKQLTDDMNSSYAPAWSPDGTQIVFVSTRRVHNDLYIMDADGSGERAIVVRDVPAEELDPAWSPDGNWIAFSSNREGDVLDLFVIRPDGSELQRLTFDDFGGDTRYPTWKPSTEAQ